jgi:DNA-directed DNA polymerase III PolC
MNYISTCNHPESNLTGSTIEHMIDFAKKQGLKYFAIADHGYMPSILRGYMYGLKKEMKIIPGIEIYFKDFDCPVAQNTPSEKIKYFKLLIHAIDQTAYQKLVLMCSDDSKKTVTIKDSKYYLWTWKDLEDIATFNVTASTSDAEDMVTKHLIVNQPKVGLKYYEKLKELFGERYYPAVVPYTRTEYWESVVHVTLDNDKTVNIPINDRIETDESDRAKPIELTYSKRKHKKLLYVYINSIRYPVKTEHQTIVKAVVDNTFQQLPNDIQTQANKFIIALAQRYGDLGRLLINNNAYYAEKGDKIVQDMRLGDSDRLAQAQYMRGIEDVKEYLISVGLTEENVATTVQNTHDWAEKFKDFKLKYDRHLVACENPEQKLIEIIKKNGRMKWDDPVYVSRFRKEYEVIVNNGVINLVPYFLPIVGILDLYLDNGELVGPGRGSAAGALIAYLLGITHVDPIKADLSFDRFLTVDRLQAGDIADIDIDLPHRDLLVGTDTNSGYLYHTYGKKAAQISTRTLLRLKSSILDTNRYFNGGSVDPEIEKFSKSLPTPPQGLSDSDFVFGYTDSDGNHIEGLIETSETLQKYAIDRPKEWEMVKKALSLSRQYSRHASAFVISDRNIEDIVPIFQVGETERVTQPEAKQCEFVGLVKYDLLVIACLRDLTSCLRYINDQKDPLKTGYFYHNGIKTFIWDLPEDPEVFKMLSRGETETVFQLSTQTMTPYVKKIQPQSIEDLSVIEAIVRPGTLDYVDPDTNHNMADEYVLRRFGQSTCPIPELLSIIPETYGIIAYQEQLVKVVRQLAGFTAIEGEQIRKGTGKKLIKLLDSYKPRFIEGASKKIARETAEKIWDMMITFGRYSFNKSHSYCYSTISYACAFLKYHYPLEWWASILTNATAKEINEKFYPYVRDMVLPPDINVSTERITIDYKTGKLRNKLSTITGLGKKAAEKMMGGRPYANIQDFVNKEVCGPSMAKKIIHVGILDSLFPETYRLDQKILAYEQAVKLKDFNDKVTKLQSDSIAAELSKDMKKYEKICENLRKFEKTSPKEAQLDPSYLALTPKKDFQIKKSIFPTMNLDLMKVLLINSNSVIFPGHKFNLIMGPNGADFPLFPGEYLQRIDGMEVPDVIKFCVPGYVVSMEEFSYQNGSKKALKLIIDSSGYISEKVIWPDYDTGVLEYPKNLNKGAIVFFFYQKKPQKPYTNIIHYLVDEDPIL